MPRDPHTYVVALSYQRFVSWCRDKDLWPGAATLHYVGPDDRHRLMGVVLRRGVDRVINIGGGTAEILAYVETRFRA